MSYLKIIFIVLLLTTVSVEVSTHHGGNPYVTPEDFKGYEAAINACKDSFGKEPIPQKDGGSIPIVPMFESILGLRLF